MASDKYQAMLRTLLPVDALPSDALSDRQLEVNCDAMLKGLARLARPDRGLAFSPLELPSAGPSEMAERARALRTLRYHNSVQTAWLEGRIFAKAARELPQRRLIPCASG